VAVGAAVGCSVGYNVTVGVGEAEEFDGLGAGDLSLFKVALYKSSAGIATAKIATNTKMNATVFVIAWLEDRRVKLVPTAILLFISF
jgi:hypothetical protein